MQIDLPVTAFTKKIIFAERNIPLTERTRNAVIPINEDDELFDLIRFKGRLTMYHKAIKVLSETITIEISNQHAQELGEDTLAIGIMLDRHFKRLLCRAVEFRSLSNTPKVRSISDFLDSYDIEDDEYSRETSIKRVHRFFVKKTQKNTAFLAKKQETIVRPFSPKTPLSESYLDTIFIQYKELYPSYFYNKKRKPRIHLPQQVQVWIYRNIGGWHYHDIAKKFKINPKTIYKNIQAFEAEFQHKHKPTPLISATLSL